MNLNGFKIVSRAILINEATITYTDEPNVTNQTYQAEFPRETPCCKCSGKARLAFVYKENHGDKKFLSQLYPNKGGDGGDYWLHDACAIAVYLCKKCLEPTTLCNQG